MAGKIVSKRGGSNFLQFFFSFTSETQIWDTLLTCFFWFLGMYPQNLFLPREKCSSEMCL